MLNATGKTVVILANTAWYIYNFRLNLIRRLQGQGYRVLAVSPSDAHAKVLERLGIRHCPIFLSQTGRNPGTEIHTLLSLHALFLTEKPQWVLSFTVKCNIYAGLLSRLHKYRQIANISGLGEAFDSQGVLNDLTCWLYRIALKGCHSIFFQNPEDYRFFTENRLANQMLCSVLPGSGVDLSRFRPHDAIPDSAKLANGGKVFLMFGRILEKKGFGLFASAAEKLSGTHAGRARFWVVGFEDKARPESQLLFRRLMSMHESGLITYFPASDCIEDHIHKADVIVLPSTYNEGVPRSLLEALACGKPILATDWKGCRETVDDGKNGFLLQPNSLADLVQKISHMAEMREQDLKAMGRHSRRMAEAKFDEKIVIKNYIGELSGVDPDAGTNAVEKGVGAIKKPLIKW